MLYPLPLMLLVDLQIMVHLLTHESLFRVVLFRQLSVTMVKITVGNQALTASRPRIVKHEPSTGKLHHLVLRGVTTNDLSRVGRVYKRRPLLIVLHPRRMFFI